MLIHGTCVDLDGAGVLLRGSSGSGKSDLALRLLDRGGARLVSDDQVEVSARGGRLTARAPKRLAGLLEVRGVGIVRVARVEATTLVLVADLCAPDAIERMPEPVRTEIGGVGLPLIRVDPGEPSAPAKVRVALGMRRREEAAVD